MKRIVLCGLAAAMLVSFVSYNVRACGYHGVIGNGFSAQYPGSIEVAIALREAADAGVIDPAALVPQKADLFAYRRAVQRLQKLRGILADREAGNMRPFTLLLVESALWSRYAAEDGKMSVTVHTGGPQAGEAVMITGEAVIAAIDASKLSWDDAVQRKLIVVVPADD